MKTAVTVQIIGAPIACPEGVKDTWREIAHYVSGNLEGQFGPAVQVVYFDLFDPACPPLPPQVQLPLILIDNEVLTSGGKISLPAIRKKLLELGIEIQSGLTA